MLTTFVTNNPPQIGVTSIQGALYEPSPYNEVTRIYRSTFNNDTRVIHSPYEINTLPHANLHLKEPIAVKYEMEANQYIAEAIEINEFGHGDTWDEAVEDLQEAIVELYLFLEVEEDRLGKELARVWRVLSRKVQRMPIKVREFDSVVRKFNFDISEGRRHIIATLKVEGKSVARTLRSRQSSGADLPSQRYQSQLYLSRVQLEDAIKCDLGYEDYLDILRTQDVL